MKLPKERSPRLKKSFKEDKSGSVIIKSKDPRKSSIKSKDSKKSKEKDSAALKAKAYDTLRKSQEKRKKSIIKSAVQRVEIELPVNKSPKN